MERPKPEQSVGSPADGASRSPVDVTPADPARRDFVRASAVIIGAGTAALVGAEGAAAQTRRGRAAARPRQPIRRIATEEAFTTPRIAAATNAYLAGEGRTTEPAFVENRKIAGQAVREAWARRLVDMGELRRREMADAGIDTQILLLASPGVQIFPADQAVELARHANDAVAPLCRADPGRFAALAVIAPQDPRAAADELTRAVRQLGCRGALINSHTRGEYLDDRKFWPILETAQAFDVPIYLHPREPSPAMAAPFASERISGAIWGYAVETGTHALRMILGGVFDAFPRLQIILGHGGESLPFFVDRIDTRFAVDLLPGGAKPLRHKPSSYLRNNFIVTTSGLNWADPVKLCVSVMGVDRVMFAADWPFEDATEAVKIFDSIGFDEATARRLYETNARRVFKLDR